MVVCTVHLPITLIRIWGTLQDRRFSLLRNFMDLTSSVQLANQRSVSERIIQDSETLMYRYLTTMKALFKDTKIQPIHHAALHAGDFLRLFGPNHSVRTFGGERYLEVLGLQNVNNKSGSWHCTPRDMYASHNIPGELEATFMTSVCRSSNLQALMDTCKVPEQAEPLLTAYGSVANEDHRGTRLADQDHHPPTKPPSSDRLDDDSYRLLLQMLNEKFGTTRYTPGGGQAFSVTQRVDRLEKVSIRGIVYACEKSLPRDSNVLFRRPGRSSSKVGKIWSIFRLQHPTPEGSTVEATYVLVREYLPFLNVEMQSQYKQFGFAGGFLCHSKRWSRFHVVELADVICHFAKTVIRDGDGDVMHVLPLNKVGFSLSEYGFWLTMFKMMESYALPSVVV